MSVANDRSVIPAKWFHRMLAGRVASEFSIVISKTLLQVDLNAWPGPVFFKAAIRSCRMRALFFFGVFGGVTGPWHLGNYANTSNFSGSARSQQLPNRSR